MSSRSLTKKEPDSAKDLDDIAKRLLRAAGVGDKLPTPQDDIIGCAELIMGGEIDLEDFRESRLKKFGRAFLSGMSKIWGILDVRDRTIYINPDIHENSKPFVKFHEVAHKVIPWQVETYDLFGDNFYTLRPDIEDKFDKEANYLSAKLLFQNERFEKEARDYKFSLSTGIMLAQRYGASYHSTLWYYSETNTSKCILLILRECNYYQVCKGNSEKPYRLIYTVPSKNFLKEFGEINWVREYDSKHQFTAIVHDSQNVEIYEGEVELENKYNETVKMNFEAWSNSYNIFILIWKKQRLIIPPKRVLFNK